MKRLFLLALIFLSLALPVYAQDGSQQELPQSLWLEGLQQHWQQYNRCSAAALTIQLSYFDWPGSHTQVARWLNHNSEDVSVRLEEMIQFVEEQGLKGIARIGGTTDLLMALVAGGFPVLIETAYYDASDSWDDWMSHNRIVMGYEGWPQEIFYVFDPLMGNGPADIGRPMPFYELDSRWQHFNRDYLVIYRPEEEERLRQILGQHWDIIANAEWTLEQAQADWEFLRDSFSLFNVGSALTVLGRYEEAAEAFDQARELGLTRRMLWYRFEIFEAYLQMGRYDDVIALVYQVLEGTRGVDEMYYYIGRAYEGKGDLERARSNYSAAVYRNPHYIEAQAALARVGG